MTVTNFQASVVNGSLNCTWDATQDFSFLYEDAEVIARLASGVTTWSGILTAGAVYQAQDSATASPDPAPENPVPKRRITIFWDEIPDSVRYEVTVNGSIKGFTAGEASYTYKTPRLPSGLTTITVAAFDAAGNESAAGDFTYEIFDVPNPLQGLVLTQSGATNITATLVAPVGF